MAAAHTERIAYREHQPGIKPMLMLHRAVQEGPLERSLVELVRTRASKING